MIELPFPLDKYLQLLFQSVLLFLVLMSVVVALLLILLAICYFIALLNRRRISDYY
jgi:Na+-transporting methylmalonyl-CoA/oxaloacetate decarboxylase gamma subunit